MENKSRKVRFVGEHINNKVNAIKSARFLLGLKLMEAKDFVEGLMFTQSDDKSKVMQIAEYNSIRDIEAAMSDFRVAGGSVEWISDGLADRSIQGLKELATTAIHNNDYELASDLVALLIKND